MKSKLQQYREANNLTQKELAEKSGVSIRTIQRIESGTPPKGYTLKTLAAALAISTEALTETDEPAADQTDYTTIKLINLAALAFIIPLGNIALPVFLMFYKKAVNPLTKQLITLQIIWTGLTAFLILLSILAKRALALETQLLLPLLGLSCIANTVMIVSNAAALDQHKQLRIKLNFNLI